MNAESGTPRPRHVIHVDMNAFYCACHAADDPAHYADRPTAVAGNPKTRHGILVTASYEARRRGVRATMSVHEALRLCPELTLIVPDFDLYRAYSKRAFDVVRSFTPVVEVFSIDECWADISGSRQFGDALTIAKTIQQRLLEDVGLPSSIGISENKFLSKMASDMQKPMGLTPLYKADIEAKLWSLPVVTMFGVGQSTAERLNRLGIHTMGDLARADIVRLHRLFGKRALELVQHAQGDDERPVNAERDPMKSVGHSVTLPEDERDVEALHTVLFHLSDQVGRRMRHQHATGRTVTLTIRYNMRETVTRAKTLPAPTDLTQDIYATARQLLTEHRTRDRGVRLLGVTVSQLSYPHEPAVDEGVQLTMFSEPAINQIDTQKAARLAALTKVTDQLRDKYGERIVLHGRLLKQSEGQALQDKKRRGTSLQKDGLE